MRYVAATLILLGVVEGNRASAQEARATLSSRDSALATILGNAPESSRLRMRTANGERFDDPKPRLANDSVLIRYHESTQMLAISDIDSVWVQHGTLAGIFGAIAAAPCAIYGALVGHSFANDPDSNGHPGSLGLREMIVGVGLGTVICGGPGAILGSFIKRWHLIYPIRRAPKLHA